MAFQIYEPKEYPTMGSLLGSAIGQGISGTATGFGNVLQSMASNKLQNMYQQQQESKMAEALKAQGLKPELAKLGPYLQYALPTALKAQAEQGATELESQLFRGPSYAQAHTPGGSQQTLTVVGSPMEQITQPGAQKTTGLPQVATGAMPAQMNQQPGMQVPQGAPLAPNQPLPKIMPMQQTPALPQLAPEEQEMARHGIITEPEIAHTRDIIDQLRGKGFTKHADKYEDMLDKKIANRVTFLSKKEEKATKLSAAEEKKQKEDQKGIDSKNRPYQTLLTKSFPIAEDMYKTANQMEHLLDKGTVTNGIMGYRPYVTLNSDSQQFASLGADLIMKVAAAGGQASKMKLLLAEKEKPALYQDPQTQRALVQAIKDKANRVLKRAEIRDALLRANDDNEPKAFESKINEEFKRLYPELAASEELEEKSSPSTANMKFGKTYKDLPSAEKKSVNDKIYDDVKKVTYKVVMRNGKKTWSKV